MIELGKLLTNQLPFTVGNAYLFGYIGTKNEEVVEAFKSKMEEQFTFKDVDSTNVERYINPEVLQKKYGGYLEDLIEYWPPRCLQDATKTLDENTFIANNIIPFTLSDSEYLNFERESVNLSPTIQRSKNRILPSTKQSIIESTDIHPFIKKLILKNRIRLLTNY